jgi:hypothetical protein
MHENFSENFTLAADRKGETFTFYFESNTNLLILRVVLDVPTTKLRSSDTLHNGFGFCIET